jgi:hypothetical protein
MTTIDNTGLIFYYPLMDNSYNYATSPPTNDVAFNNINASFVGKSLYFNNSNSTTGTSNNCGIPFKQGSISSGGFTIACWFRNANPINNTFKILSFSNGAYSGLSYNGSNLILFLNTNAGTVSFPNSINTAWHHYCITVGNSEATTYVDDVSKNRVVTTATANGVLGSINVWFELSRWTNGLGSSTPCKDAYYNQFIAFNRVLTRSEITSLYQTGRYSFINYPTSIGTDPIITNSTPGPGLGNLTVTFTPSVNANASANNISNPSPNPLPTYYYNVNGGVNILANISTTSNTFIVTGLTNAVNANIGFFGNSTVGSTNYSYFDSPAPYIIGNAPNIVSITPGRNSLSVAFENSTNANPAPYYFYNVNGNTFANSTYNSNANVIVIGGLSSAILCNVGLRGQNSFGNTSISYRTETPYIIGSSPVIGVITQGVNQITVAFSQSTVGTSPTKYYYSYDGVTLLGSPVNNSPITIPGVSTTITFYIIANNPAGNIASNPSTYFYTSIGTNPTITSITPGLNTLTVNFNASQYANPLPYYFYNVNGNTFGNSTYNSNTNPIVINNLTNAIACNVGLRGVNSVGTSSTSYLTQTPYVIGTTPNIVSITPGLNSLSVAFAGSTNANPTPYYYYNVNGNTFANSTYNSNANVIVIGNLTNAVSCNVGLMGVSSVGNTGTRYLTSMPYVIGTTPNIVSVTPGLNSLSVEFAGSTNANPIPYYFYNVNGNTFANSTYNSNANVIVIGNLTSAVSCNVGLVGVSLAGNTSSSYQTSMPYVIGTTPNIVSITPELNSLSVAFASSTNANPTPYYYYSVDGTTFANSTLNSNASSITISNLNTLKNYSIQLKGVSSAGNTSSSSSVSAQPLIIGSAPLIGTVTPGLNQLSIAFTQSTVGTSPTTYYYSLDGTTKLGSGTTTSPLVITGISSSTTFYIIASNLGGDIVSTSTGTGTPYIVGSTPLIGNVTPVDGSENALDVSFAESTGGVPTLTKYQYSLNGGSFQDAVGTTSPIRITGLTAGTPYIVRLKALSGSVWTSSNSTESSSVTTNKKGSAPTINKITGAANSLIVDFTGSTGGSPSPSTYYYSLDGGNYVDAKTANSPLTIKSLTTIGPYLVKIYAVNAAGNSPESNEVSGTPIIGSDAQITPATYWTQSASFFVKSSFWKKSYWSKRKR